jgi:membrane protease YdiL (CAAX protease family)
LPQNYEKTMNVKLKGIWADKTPYSQFMILVGIVLLSIGLSLIIAVALLEPIFGINLAKDPTILSQIDNPAVMNALKFMQTIQAISFIIPPFLMALLIYGKPKEYLKVNIKPSVVTMLMAGLVMLFAMPLINWLGEMNSRLILPESLKTVEQWMRNAEDQAKVLSEAFLKMNSLGSYLMMTFMMAILPAIGEELLFRGLIQRMFGDWVKNKHTAIILTAIIFSAIHVQFYGFVPRMVMGIVLGYLMLWSGSIWVPIFAHFVNNATVVLFTYIGFDDIDAVGTSGVSGLILFTTSIVAVGAIMYMIQKREEKHRAQRNKDFKKERF